MRPRRLVGIVLVLGIIAACSTKGFSQQGNQSVSAAKPTDPAKKSILTGQTARTFSKKITRTAKGRYLLYLPEEYGKGDKSWPMILFLHGAGERAGRGKIHPKLSKVGLPKTLQQGAKFPFIVLTPQCPSGKWWTDPDVTEMVMAMLEEVCEKYKVDQSRIYLTGLSMGGFGTWDLAQKYPRRFAAIVPVCGGGNLYLNRRLKKVPAWVFHGAKDKRVSVRNAYEMAGSLKQMGGNVQLHIYPNLGHFVWDKVYTNPKLYQWLMRQKLSPAKKSPRIIKRAKSAPISKPAAKSPTTIPAGK